jgi:hypothetical protein
MTPDPPAGGAPLADVVAFLLLSAAGLVQLVALTRRFRRGGAQWLRRAAEAVGRFLGLPTWAGLPVVITLVSLTVSLHGFYWDVSIHIDEGRDPSVFANPAHWMVAGGLVGTFLGGTLSVIIGTGSPTRSSIRIADGWHAPAMGVIVTVCGVIAFLGFPLDDVWHRIAGQDVALWGPMHLVDVGGSSLAGIAMWGLLIEAGAADPEVRTRPGFRILNLMLSGALLLGLSDLQAEFDFGAPSFGLAYHPLLVAVAAGCSLVAARVAIGPGGALAAVVSYVSLRAGVAVFVGGIFDHTAPLFPLHLGSAVLVELIALVGFRRRRSLAWGAGVGAVVGTVGLLIERAWVNGALRVEWPDSMTTEALVLGALGGTAGGLLGAALGQVFGPPHRAPLRLPAAPLAIAALVLVVLLAYLAPRTAPDGITARVELRATDDPATRTALVELDPAGAAEDARWFMVYAFRGGGQEVVPLERVGPGRYRSTAPFPVGDRWNTLIRLHAGRRMLALPISQPYDDAIPAPAVEAEDRFTRSFVADRAVVQRESVDLDPGAERVAYGLSAVLSAVMVWALVAGLRRLQRTGPARPHPEAVLAAGPR